MFRRVFRAHVLAAFLAALLCPHALQSQQITPVIAVANPPNTPAQQAKHYVILVSLDGFRYDYPTKYGAPHIQSMATVGASAPDGMLPSYPSLTFPNHLSLVTGLYPEHHGIVANSFYDPAREDTYVYTQPMSNGDGTWYSGTPLWSLAEQQGMRSACLFWPGSEAEIAGKRPSYYSESSTTGSMTKSVLSRSLPGLPCRLSSVRTSSLSTIQTWTTRDTITAPTPMKSAPQCIMSTT